MHIDYWVPEGVTNELLVKIVNTVDGGEDIESLGTTVSGTWQSIDIDMAGFDGGNLSNKEKITQILQDKKVSEVAIKHFMEVLEDCDFARYAPSTTLEMKEEYEKAKEIIIELDKQF